jgi:hypothetical protein
MPGIPLVADEIQDVPHVSREVGVYLHAGAVVAQVAIISQKDLVAHRSQFHALLSRQINQPTC